MSAVLDQELKAPATSAAPPPAAYKSEVTTPVVVSLGKKKKKAVKRLKRGKGPAMAEVMEVVEQVQANLGAQADGKVIVPVVVVYKQKQRRLRGLF